MTDPNDSPFLKEKLGFSEGVDVEIYFVDSRGGEARRIGFLRPDYSQTVPRLYQRTELKLDSPETQDVYFGQADSDPHIIKLKTAAKGEYKGELETELFIASAELIVYSPYEKERFIFTLDIRKNESRGTIDTVLPDAWVKKKDG